MKQRHHTPEQVIRKLAEGEKLLGEGKSIDEVARHLEITESTWHRWRNQYGGMKADDSKSSSARTSASSGSWLTKPSTSTC
jgi:transposase